MTQYKAPHIELISITPENVLCSSGQCVDYNHKRYFCPIKGVYCLPYDEHMQEYKKTIEYFAKTKDKRTFLTGPDENSCPNKKCLWFIEWQKQQQGR